MRIKGEITVFLSLVLVVLLSVLFTVIEGARTNAVLFQTECVADMALQSVLAEYNRELLEQYDLFFIDLGYGSEESGNILLEQHLEGYMNDNFDLGTDVSTETVRDLLNLTAESATILRATCALDYDGGVLEREAVDYMLDRYGLLDLPQVQMTSEAVEENGLLENIMEDRRQKNEREIDAVDTTVEDSEGNKEKIPVNNPADAVNSRRGSSGILKLVTKGNEISDREAQLGEYISHRGYKEKDGFLLGESAVDGAEELLFQKYLMEKCGNYIARKENSFLAYQMEYILTGKSSDTENLRGVVNRLLVIRETANFIYIMSDSGKQSEAEALAMTLAAVILFPELKDLIKLSILIAWSFAESVNDVRLLLDGGKVPLWKSGDSWKLSLQNAMKLNVGEDGGGNETGLSYQEYLHVLLAVMDRRERVLRFMDIVEMDVRQKPGNRYFRMDNCIHAFETQLLVRSGTGHSCLITRTAGYEK